MTKFYFGKTRENTGKACKNMGKHWMTKFQFGKTRENIGKTSGKHEKTINNIGKYWMTKFYFGKTWETTRKTWENMQKHGKALDDKVLFQENMGKH